MSSFLCHLVDTDKMVSRCNQLIYFLQSKPSFVYLCIINNKKTMAIKKTTGMGTTPKKPTQKPNPYTTKPSVSKTTYTRSGVTFVKNPDGTFSKKTK